MLIQRFDNFKILNNKTGPDPQCKQRIVLFIYIQTVLVSRYLKFVTY